MAKINLTNQQNQENASVVLTTLASFGVLMCMVVTVLGIKLWWFKHRLSFEQTATQNGAAGGNSPMVVVPKRNKKQRFQKDRRWSQQISENVEVHGVFRQKQEDDLDIQRPQKLPPVRIRQLSASTQSLILPPLRNKPRTQQVHSTAFEDMEIATSTVVNSPAPSSTTLTSNNDSDARLSLTFEEFEKQFNIKEIKPEICKTPLTSEVNEKPEPPLRLNRSSSAMEKPQKPQHFLKSSQSITIPEFHKVIERRPTGFSRPTEDLTKIDDYEETQLFENFVERRPTGYIKYEEVDRDLNEQELNQKKGNSNQGNLFHYKFTENGNWESFKELQVMEALRNEQIMYQNSSRTENFVTSFSDDDFMKTNDNTYNDFPNNNKYKIVKSFDTSEILATDYEYSNEHRRPKGSVRDEDLEMSNDLATSIDSDSMQDDFDNQFSDWPQYEEKIETPKVNTRKFENHDFERQTVNKKEKNPMPFDLPETDSSDQEFFEKSRLNQRRPTGYNLNWVDENIESDDVSESESLEKVNQEKSSLQQKTLYSQMRSLMQDETNETLHKTDVRFELRDSENSGNEGLANSNLKQRRPTNYVRKEEGEAKKELEISSLNYINVEEDQTVRSVNFNLDEDQDFEKSSLKQRRPTGYVRKTNKENEEDEIETHQHKVNFEISSWPENNVENYSLNKRRPTGYIRNPIAIRDSDDYQDIVINEIKDSSRNLLENFPDDLEYFEKWIEKQRHMKATASNGMLSKDFTKSQVTFENSIDFKSDKDHSNSKLKLRRPTGYIKKSHAKELTNEDESDLKVSFATSADFKDTDFDNAHTTPRRPTEFIQKLPQLFTESTERDVEKVFKNPEINDENSQSSIKEIKPTGFVRTPDIEKLFGASKQVNFNLNDLPAEEHLNHVENEALKARRPTGYVRRSEIDSLENLETTPITWHNNALNSNDEDPLWQELEKDLEPDFKQNLEEEFAKIRHSYELNEGDFLELKRELKLSQIKPTGFGKTLEDDVDNFEKFKTPKITKLQQENQGIQIISNDQDLSTTSILKESKIQIENQQIIKHQEEIQPLPRKSKVTFDFKTEERIIPARNTELDSEEDDYYEDTSDYDANDDDNAYSKPPTGIPPQPMQRLTEIDYNTQSSISPSSLYTPVVAKPTTITLFGSQISKADNVEDDSWSAIRKHRNLNVEFQQLSIDSTSTSSPPSFNTPLHKPAYRNPLAQLAIQRAKEVRMDMEGFKPRSINDAKKHPEAALRNREKKLNLHYDDVYDTDA